jgi:hypothetical protein
LLVATHDPALVQAVGGALLDVETGEVDQ